MKGSELVVMHPPECAGYELHERDVFYCTTKDEKCPSLVVKKILFEGDGRRPDRERALRSFEEVSVPLRMHGTPHIVRVLGVRHVDTTAFYSMPHVGVRSNLASLSFDEARQVLHDTVYATACLHATGFMHRDIACDNIMVAADAGGVKHATLCDFGNCSPIVRPHKTQKACKAAYQAPEVHFGEIYFSPADVWSLGVVALELFAGRPPWDMERRDLSHYKLALAVGGSTEGTVLRPGEDHDEAAAALWEEVRGRAETSALGEAAAAHVRAFVEATLRFIPEQRHTAPQLLRLPIFEGLPAKPEVAAGAGPVVVPPVEPPGGYLEREDWGKAFGELAQVAADPDGWRRGVEPALVAP